MCLTRAVTVVLGLLWLFSSQPVKARSPHRLRFKRWPRVYEKTDIQQIRGLQPGDGLRLEVLVRMIHSREAAPLLQRLHRRSGSSTSGKFRSRLLKAMANGRYATRQPFPWRSGGTGVKELSRTQGTLLNLLASVADSGGLVHQETLERRFGPSATRLVRSLIRRARSGLSYDGTAQAELISHANDEVLRWFVAEQNLVPRMPALDKLVQHYGFDSDLGQNLKQVRVLAHQHILGNTEGLLLRAGIKPQNTLVWGKPYSLDPRVAADLHLRGFRMQGTSVKQDARRIERYIAEQLRQVKHPELHKKPLFVIVDDGGELISIVARIVRRKFPQFAHLFAGVEQTNRGLWRLRRQDLPFAVFNMAGSWAKKKYGSPMFGYAVSRETMTLLYRLRRQGLEVPKMATVMGAGNIGFNAAMALRRAGYDVLVYDKDPEKRKLARRSGFSVVADKRKALAHAHVLVSCAGGVTLTSRTLRHLPDGAVVINGASSGEFRLRNDRHVRQVVPARGSRLSREGVRLLADGRAVGKIRGSQVLLNELPELPHQIWRTNEGKRILVARSGGVINFPLGLADRNSGNAIPARYIQLEIGLLYLGMVQASWGGAAPGIQDYNLQPQRFLVSTIQDQLKARSENLLWPKW